jgi:hypothetical protein
MAQLFDLLPIPLGRSYRTRDGHFQDISMAASLPHKRYKHHIRYIR